MNPRTARAMLVIMATIAIAALCLSGCSALDALGPKPAQPDPCAKPDTARAGHDTTFTVHACLVR